MNASSHLEEIFFAALERSNPVEQAEFLRTACGADTELRQKVVRLLAAHPLAQDFLSRPAVDRMAVETSDGALQTQTFRMDDASDADGDQEVGNEFAFLSPGTRTGSLGRIGHYEVLNIVGRGAFGIVFRALDESLLRVVAVKVLPPQLAASSHPRRRFLREARSSARVRHTNIVQVYAVEEQPLPYLVMEFIPGETLQQRLDRLGPLAGVEVAEIGRQVAEGLAEAHAAGLIHRDIKPGNIMIETDKTLRVKITDFGLARVADDASLTQSGMIAGTPMYMSPEQVAGEPLDPRADLFSLGSVLYTLCTGQPPFRAKSTIAALKRVADETPRPISEIVPEVPGWLCDIIERLHAKRPDDRIANAKELAELLERGLIESRNPGTAPWRPFAQGTAETDSREGPASGDRELTADPVPAPDRPVAGARRLAGNRRWAAAAAVLIAVAGLGFTEANGLTDFRGTVVRLLSPAGTLVVEVDDPDVSVKIDGAELVITGAGLKEIRVQPGSYTVEASRQGKVLLRELVNVEKNGRQVVRVSQEAQSTLAKDPTEAGDATNWERLVAAMRAEEQVRAVVARLMELNPSFDGVVIPTIENHVVTGLQFRTDNVTNIAPVRALRGLTVFDCAGTYPKQGKLADLSPLQGMSLSELNCSDSLVYDLAPLRGMPLTKLECNHTPVSDLSPLRGMELKELFIAGTSIRDLSPLTGMKLRRLHAMAIPATDLTPLRGIPLVQLDLHGTSGVSDLQFLEGMPLEYLNLTKLPVKDLAVLKDMSTLRFLVLADTLVSDITPLRDLKIQGLHINGTPVTNIDVLSTMELKRLQIDFQPDRAEFLRSLKGLEIINNKPVADFWKEVDAKQKPRAEPDK